MVRCTLRMVSRERLPVVPVGAEQLDDLPDVEPASDYPRPARTPAESHPRMQPRLGRLLRQLLHHDTARPA